MIGEKWRGLSFETKAALAFLAALVVVVAGFLAATSLSRLASPADAGERPETLTVERVVTHTSTGVRTVVQTVRVGSRRARASVLGTSVELLTVTAPGPPTRVTLPGRASTIVETRAGRTRTSVVTDERVVTDRRVVTSERVVTTDRTVTSVRTELVTVPVTTIRTVTDLVPVTQTVTTTQILTETVVPPPGTVTVTVTCPPKGCG